MSGFKRTLLQAVEECQRSVPPSLSFAMSPGTSSEIAAGSLSTHRIHTRVFFASNANVFFFVPATFNTKVDKRCTFTPKVDFLTIRTHPKGKTSQVEAHWSRVSRPSFTEKIRMMTPLRGQCVRCERPRPLALLVLVSLAALSTSHAALFSAFTLEPGGIAGPRTSRSIPSSARDGGCFAWAPAPTVMAGVGRGAWVCGLRQPGWAPGRIGKKLQSTRLEEMVRGERQSPSVNTPMRAVMGVSDPGSKHASSIARTLLVALVASTALMHTTPALASTDFGMGFATPKPYTLNPQHSTLNPQP